jgi:phage baseplate assembly protein W
MSTTITTNNPRISSERSFRDLDLNFGIHPIKKDVTKHVNEYAVINSVKNLVLTNFYERPFRPEIGSGVRNLLFEMVDTVTAEQLERAISEVIANFEKEKA